MARTPVFRMLQRCARMARAANRPDAPAVPELIDIRRDGVLSRRRFLATTGTAALSLGGIGLLSSCGVSERSKRTASEPRIVIVGGGLSGLTAAWTLKKAGVRADIYEASKRTGGRTYTARGLLGPDLTTEVGGEFIDSTHEDMLSLIEEFQLELMDTHAPSEEEYVDAWHFGGRLRTEEEIIEAYRPLAAAIEKDVAGLGDVVDYRHDGGARRLDNLSISGYLEKAGVSGWIANLIEVAYISEYGLDCGEQSSLNLLFMISTDLSGGSFDIYGESDERYKVRGGNQRVADELARRLEDQIETEHRLESLRTQGQGYQLTFETSGGSARDVDADMVLMTIPFSVLRDVHLDVDLPRLKLKAIRELGYGTNCKVFAGFKSRLWRALGYSGSVLSEQSYQCAWDNSRMQERPTGGITLYLGGAEGIRAGTGTAEFQAQRYLRGLETTFPGLTAQSNGVYERFHWPSHSFTKGSYSAYRPGQWTTISGMEGKSVRNLFFAGEHCSSDFQGFMNGAAETGKRAAREILASAGVNAVPEHSMQI